MNIERKIEIENRPTRLGELNGIIEYEHLDGTYCRFTNATYKDYEEEWFCIYTEHNGNHINHKSDVKWVKEIKENILYFNSEEQK